MRMNPARILIPFILLTLAACAHPISQGMRETLDPGVSLSGLFESPDNYVGKRVMLGGNIVATRNFPDKSEIEVVQKPIDYQGYVSTGDETMGRFIFRKPGYLESEIYAKGRDLIGAGKVVGSQAGKIGDRDYQFPVIEAEELNLQEIKPDYPYYYYYDPYYPFYYGYGPGHHFYGHHYY